RSLKTERIYVNEYTTPKALRAGIQEYIYEYNTARPHQTYNYMTPMQVYLAQRIAA
ncbi:MAG: transposase, partial [Firmicutes bacterium]|nr:transposase [Bacillota bacterium]